MLPLIVLCASHIRNPERALLLRSHIQSIMEQTHKVHMYVSISGNLPFDILSNDTLHVYTHGQTMSQFEHYNFLSKIIKGQDDVFCVFCDDDDFSHPDRCRFYASCTDQGQIGLLASESLFLLNDNNVVDGHEYFMFSMRLSKLRRFCEILDDHKCLQSPVCDLLLGSVLIKSKTLSRTCKPTKWLYAYNNKDKYREDEIVEYDKLLANSSLIESLEKEFNIEKGKIGPTSVYG